MTRKIATNHRAKLSNTEVPHALVDDVRPGQSIELLKELHILTRDGKLNQDSRRKLKQVYHLYQFIEKLLLELGDGQDENPSHCLLYTSPSPRD